MAAAKIIVVEKNEGEKIAYDVSTTKIIFGDDDLMVNIKNRERDEEVTLDICKDTQDGLTVGVNTEAREYVAQVIIPARGYEIVDTGEKDEDGKTITKREPVPFDMKKCTLVLWALGLRTKTSYARSYRTEVKRNFRSRTLQNLYWSQSFLLTLWVCISVSK